MTESIRTARAFTFRPIDWRRDRKAIIGLDASFRTERVYRVQIEGLSAKLVEERLARPRVKRYDLSEIGTAVKDSDMRLAAHADDELAGFMTVKYERWNRRGPHVGPVESVLLAHRVAALLGRRVE